MAREKPLNTSADWQRFLRERKRAEFAITNGQFARFVLIWMFLMLLAHLNGRW